MGDDTNDLAAKIQSFCPVPISIAEALVECRALYGITDTHEFAMFLAQTAHESADYKRMREIWGPTPQQARYSQRADLGNTDPRAVGAAKLAGMDVGRFYAGHGAIQITGFDNHLAYSMSRYGDDRCAKNPLLLTVLPDCILSAGWFWVTHGCPKLAAPGTADAFIAVTRRINGGENGLGERQALWQKAQVALGLSD